MIKYILLLCMVFTINGCAIVSATLNTIGVQINGDNKNQKDDNIITGTIYITNNITMIDNNIYHIVHDSNVDITAFDWRETWIIGKKINLNGKNILLILHAERAQIGSERLNKPASPG